MSNLDTINLLLAVGLAALTPAVWIGIKACQAPEERPTFVVPSPHRRPKLWTRGARTSSGARLLERHSSPGPDGR